MRTLQKTVAIVLMAFVGAVGAAGQQLHTLGVTDAVDLALDRNPRLQELRAERRAKTGEWWMGLGIDAPEITYFREGIPTGAADGFAEQRWAFSQSFNFPLQSYYGLQRTSTELEALDLNLHAAHAHVKASVKKAYTDVLYTQEILHLRGQELSLAERLVEAATVRVQVGEASELELMKAELEQAEAQSRGREAERDFQRARYALFREIGLDPDDQTYQIVFPDTLIDVDVQVTQDEVLNRLIDLPELQATAREISAAELGISYARASIFPDLAFNVYRQDYGTGYDRYGVQVGLRFPIWVFGEYRGRLRQALAGERAASWKQERMVLDQKERAEVAWHGYITSRMTMERYRSFVQARADELLRLTMEGYRLGEIDLLTLLDTQRTYLASQQRFYNALRDYYFQLIDLERILGEELVFQRPPDAHASSTIDYGEEP